MCLIDRIDIETHVHATEDEGKVLQALVNLVGPDVAKGIRSTVVMGHYNNPIKILKAELKLDNCGCDAIARGIAARLPSEDKRILELSLESRVERNRVYLRFDKQRLYLNTLSISSSDDIVRLILHLNPTAIRRMRGVVGVLKELGFIVGE